VVTLRVALATGFLATEALRADVLATGFLATEALRVGFLATAFLTTGFFAVASVAVLVRVAGLAELLPATAAFPADDFFPNVLHVVEVVRFRVTDFLAIFVFI